MFGAQQRRVAALAAAVERDRTAWHAARGALRDRTLQAVGSPQGLAIAFLAGLAAGPAARGIGRGLRSVNGFGMTLATFGLSPRDLVAGIRAARRFMAAASPQAPPDGAG
ncbi:MAG: hypothetical protein JNM50_08220 [Chromatiales bacterium]|nr:hypothetical protein [Chromatiales bacterium]